MSDAEPIGWNVYVTYGGGFGDPVPVDPDRDYAGFVPNDGPDALREWWSRQDDQDELIPIDLAAEPKSYVFLSPGWAERFKALTPRAEPE